MAELRTGRSLSEFGGYGVDVKLDHMRDTSSVVWSSGNSYVAVKGKNGIAVYSINGLGEIRWAVHNKEEAERYGADSAAAWEYFISE
tara:strand:- start:248 stop:508 length:261 start_codon:yes stop_codon:yes gene_type:complete